MVVFNGLGIELKLSPVNQSIGTHHIVLEDRQKTSTGEISVQSLITLTIPQPTNICLCLLYCTEFSLFFSSTKRKNGCF